MPLASKLAIKRNFSCNQALAGLNVCVHSGHIHISYAFANFLLNNGVDK